MALKKTQTRTSTLLSASWLRRMWDPQHIIRWMYESLNVCKTFKTQELTCTKHSALRVIALTYVGLSLADSSQSCSASLYFFCFIFAAALCVCVRAYVRV